MFFNLYYSVFCVFQTHVAVFSSIFSGFYKKVFIICRRPKTHKCVFNKTHKSVYYLSQKCVFYVFFIKTLTFFCGVLGKWPFCQILKRWFISQIRDQNVQKLQILLVFSLIHIASILNSVLICKRQTSTRSVNLGMNH